MNAADLDPTGRKTRYGPGSRFRRIVLTVVIAVGLVIAGGLGSYFVLIHYSGNGEVVRDDGPTLYQALRAINQSVKATPGGPWTLSQLYGVASPVPTDPSSWGWGPYDAVLSSCQSTFNGLTLWNGTIPLFDGTYNSGTAPFWQFVFFSNATQQLLIATDVLGTPHLYPPIAMTSECAESTGLSVKPWGMSQLFDFAHGGFPGNSPGMANAAWVSLARQWAAGLQHRPTEMFVMGAAQFGSGQPPDTMTMFYTCGTPGGAGATPGLDVFAGPPGDPGDTATVIGSFDYKIGCTPTANNFTAIPIRVNFSNTTELSGVSASVVQTKFQFELDGAPPFNGPGYDTVGITSWMTQLNLTLSNGSALPVAKSGCSAWVPSISSCVPSTSGWYAVLFSPDSEWEGSYAATSSGAGWSYPVLPIANNETIALVIPSDWNVAGDTLEITSTTASLPLSGAVVIS